MRNTDRKVSSIEGMYDEGFVTHMYDSADTITSMESSCGTGIVLYGSMIVAVLDILKN